jgi:Secretion system C-terminal sorting domain
LYISGAYNYNILNCTFYQNEVAQIGGAGGGIYEDYIDDSPVSANSTIKNCIFWKNITTNPSIIQQELYSVNTSPLYKTQISNCLVKGTGSFLNMNDAGNNKLGISFKPQFVDSFSIAGLDEIYRTADDGLHLTCITSPALNSSNATPTLTDITNATRDGIAELGAYESPCGSPAVFTSSSAICQTITKNAVTGNAWFHFTNAAGIVCSINPQNQNLGNVTAKVADPTGIVINGATRYMGRSVNLTSTIAPTTNYLLRMYFKDSEITEFQNATGQIGLTPQSFKVLWASGGTGCGVSNFYGTTGGVIDNTGVATGEFGQSNEGFYLQIALNHFTLFAASTDDQNTLVGTEESNNVFANAIIYPNPTTNDINIAITGNTDVQLDVQIFDILGRAVTQKQAIINEKANITMQDIPNGLYNLVITNGMQVITTKKIVKM